MFTGIVEEIGTLCRMKPTASSCTLTISCEKVLEGTKLGDSIAVNGTCLTVTRMDTHSFDCDVTPETLSRTSFSMVRVGSPLNLERALRLSDRLGGHIVLGHVDTTGRLISFIKEGNAVNVTISVEQKWMKYIIEKGSVAIDGVSLTVARREADRFTISPHVVFHGARRLAPESRACAPSLRSLGRSHRARPCRYHGTPDLLHQRRKRGECYDFRRAEMDEIHHRKRLCRHRRRKPHGRKARSRPLHDLPHPTYGGEDHPSREAPGRPVECRVRLPGKICGAAHEKGHGRRSHYGHA